MSRIKISFMLIFIIIIAIVGISVVIPAISYSEPNTDVIIVDDWTPPVTMTPIQTITPSFTFTPPKSTIPAATSTTAISTDCVYPAEYWEEHSELWLEMLVGYTMYSKEDIRLIFDDPSQELQPILLKQLYLANLNFLSGADPRSIQDMLGDANTWLQIYLTGKPLSEEARQEGVQLARTLIKFNTGLIGPGFCSPYEALTVTPINIIDPTLTPSLTPTSTATSVFPTLRPTSTASATKEPNEKPEPTDRPRPTKEKNTPGPKPTKEPTSAPTDAP